MPLAILLTLLLIALAPSVARAQPAQGCDASARRTLVRLRHAADAAVLARNWAAAAQYAREGLARCPSGDLQFFAAYAEAQAGHPPAVARHAQACLEACGADPARQATATACRALLERAQEAIARSLLPLTPPSASTSLPLVAPSPPPPPAPPPQPDVPILPAPLPVPPRPSTRTGSGAGVGPWILLGSGVAGLAAYAVFAGLHASALEGCSLQGGLATCGTPAQAERALASDGYALAGNLSLGLGLAALTGGLAWWWFGRAPREQSAPLQVYVAPSGAGVSGSF